ncbi:MAG TPA: hypothetical protein VJS64_18685 [Pyrinomonadaceae bacterium]|nr:hypothetical protein [Pyrinomonadaceae bacterium]
MNYSSKHIIILAAILLAVGLTYLKLPSAYFCAYDDFLEVHRAAFEDTREPARVFTTTHFTSYKYRPLNRGINLLTYWAGDGNSRYFRTRNVVCHLLNAALVYLIAWLLFRSISISGVAALLFGLHPLANQAVSGAVMTNTAAHSMFLIALVAFLLSLKPGKIRFVWLAIALLFGWLSLLTYEAAVVAYPLMFSYLLVRLLFEKRWVVGRGYTAALTFGSLMFLGSYYLIHSRFVPYSATKAIPAFNTMLENVALYVGALLLPIDPVLAHSWFGTPLPTIIQVRGAGLLLPTAIVLVLAAIAFLIWVPIRLKGRRLQDAKWSEQVFVVISGIAVLAPLIVFADKASETYLYLAVAFGAILFVSILHQILKPVQSRRGRVAFIVIVATLSISYASATWVRNRLVQQCGLTADRIMTTLHQDNLKEGIWFIWLSPVPGEPRSNRYGMYGWRGVDTIGESAVEAAAQLANNNEMLAATVLTPEKFAGACRNSRDVCFTVHEDGTTDQLRPTMTSGR